MKNFLIVFVLIFGFTNLYAQKINRWYQDGKVVFEIPSDVKKYKSTNGLILSVNSIFSPTAIYQYQIHSIKELHPNINDLRLSRTYEVDFGAIDMIEEFIQYIKENLRVVYAEKKELHESFFTPNDTYFSNSFNNGQWGLYQINALQAWDISTGDANVIVAVTDNAVQINHPDLINKVVAGRDVVDNDNDPSPCGGNDGFHGSHVSGIVGAETNNNQGVASIGYNTSIMPVKIGNCSTGALTGGYDGVIWAADNGADAINMSWGGGGVSTYGQNVCNYAWNNGVILVAAAGNDGTNQQFYPAAYNNVISVASTTNGDAKSSFSQYGTWLDIAAPGSQILSCNETNSYQFTQGTSMASPMVAGLIGLMISHAPSASPQDIINCLLSSADNIDAANGSYIGQLGSGRINAEQALVCLNAFTFTNDAGINQINSPQGQLCSSVVSPQFELKNLGSEILTSVIISYQYDNGTMQSYNWNGNLAQGSFELISLPTSNLLPGLHNFSISCSSPNGVIDQNNSNNNQSSSFNIIPNGQLISVEVITDCWGSEVQWNITEPGNTSILASGGPYPDITGGETYQSDVCLDATCYNFTITDTYGDGMSGSQYASCDDNGSYSISGSNGNIITSIQAVDSDYGLQEINNFCVTSNLSYDIGVSQIIYPSGVICDGAIEAEIELFNSGSQVVSSVDLNYNFGGSNLATSYNGSISPGSSVVLTLPIYNSTTGASTFNVTASNPNGNQDQNALNNNLTSNFYLYNSYVGLPFTETFESNSFDNNNWYITNNDNDITWEIASVVGTNPGNKAAKIDFFNYSDGDERDGIQTPPMDFGPYSNIELSFEHAFRRYNQESRDSLSILISTDCGATFEYLASYAEDGTGTFATAVTSTTEFVPTTSDWCMGTIGSDCFVIDLNAYSGISGVIIKFESVNNGIAGNNLFIDNINITGTNNGAPTASFNVENNFCLGDIIQFTDNSTGTINSWNWNFGDGNSSSNENPSHQYSSSGVYTVELSVGNGVGTDTELQTITINDLPNVSVTSPISLVCNTDGEFDLTGSPSGGDFSGPGMNGSTFNPSIAAIGSNTIIYSYTDNNGCSASSQVNISVDNCLGIEQNKLSSLVLYPNPNNGHFTFSKILEDAQVEIYSIDGKMIYNKVLSKQNKWIDISDSENGIYNLKIILNGSERNFRFVLK